jgi:hypothetical protein
MRDGGSTAGADTFRRVLSFGSWTEAGTGAIHYRIAEVLGGPEYANLVANVIGVIGFVGLATTLYYFARKPLDVEPGAASAPRP